MGASANPAIWEGCDEISWLSSAYVLPRSELVVTFLRSPRAAPCRAGKAGVFVSNGSF